MIQHVSREYTWLHSLHQVTGLIAIRGGKINKKDLEMIAENLRKVLREVSQDILTYDK
jgi:hypothetical protein